MQNPLTLGSITFDDARLENPDAISDLGLALSTAIHDFPGGVRTFQTFGTFMPPIRWRARFHGYANGISPLDRGAALRSMVIAATPVTLTFLDRTISGLLVGANLTLRNVNATEYACEFVPLTDQSSTGALLALDAASASNAVLAALALHLDALQDLAEAVANGEVTIGSVLAGAAPLLFADAGSFASSVSTSLAGVGGSLSALPVATLASLVVAGQGVVAEAAPIISTSGDPTSSSQAATVSDHANAAVNLLGSGSTSSRQVIVTNPNLSALAAQYYGDASLWTVIAQANGITDDQPIGTFNMTIPSVQTALATA